MNLENLQKICDFGCNASNLFVHVPQIITPHTVRTKGQYPMQRLFYIQSGHTKFVFSNNKEVSCSAGDIVYLPPDVTYESLWEESEDSAAILVCFELFSNQEPVALSEELFLIAHDSLGTYLEQFSRLREAFEIGALGYKIKSHAIFLDILHSLIHELLRQDRMQKSDPVHRAIFYVENHCFERISVDELAAMCALSPGALRNHFRAVTGLSPIKYKNNLMMKKAAELLRTNHFSVSEVARMIGLDDIYYFNRMFKQVYGISPGKFRSIGE